MYKLVRVQFDKYTRETKRYLLGVYTTLDCATKASDKLSKIKPIINLSESKVYYYEVTNIVQVSEKQPYGDFKTYLESIVRYGRESKLDDKQIYFAIVDYVREYFMTDEIDVYLNDENIDLQMELAPDFSIGFALNEYADVTMLHIERVGLKEVKDFIGYNPSAYITPRVIDIDTIEDFKKVEECLKNSV